MFRNVSLIAAAFAFTAAIVGGTTANAAGSTRLGVYEEFVSANCAAGKDCYVFFSPVTADTKISNVSCNFYINTSNPSLTGVSIGQAATASPAKFSPAGYVNPPYALNYGGTFTQFQFASTTQHVVPKGLRPAIQIGWNTAATSAASCSISGTTSALLPAESL